MIPPVVILIAPQMGENIGAVARAMMNFGMRELRIVNPRDGWPNAAAEAMAAHGAPIIHAAKIFSSTRDALDGLHYVYAATARDRRMKKPQITSREMAGEMAQKTAGGQKMGLMFGPERAGLENDDIALCHAIVTIPTDPNHSSLNIAQSAVVLAYEWFCASGQVMPTESAIPATADQVHGFLDALEQSLDKTNYFKTDEKKVVMWQNLRATYLSSGFSAEQLSALRGMITALTRTDVTKR